MPPAVCTGTLEQEGPPPVIMPLVSVSPSPSPSGSGSGTTPSVVQVSPSPLNPSLHSQVKSSPSSVREHVAFALQVLNSGSEHLSTMVQVPSTSSKPSLQSQTKLPSTGMQIEFSPQ